MLCTNIFNLLLPSHRPQQRPSLSVNDLVELYDYRYIDNYRLHQAEQELLVQLKESTGR